MIATSMSVIEKEELHEMEQKIAQLNLEIQENSAVSERLVKSYAALKAHQNALLREVYTLLDSIEGNECEIQESVKSVKELVMTDIGKHNVMH